MNVASAFKQFGVVLREVKEAPKDSVWKVPPCDVLFFASDADLADTLEGLAVCRVLDPLRLLFANQGYRCQSIAYPGSKLVGKETFFDVLSLTKTVLWRRLFRMFAHIRIKIGRRHRESLAPEYEVFQKVLQRLHPKLILAIDSNPDLCRAALGLGIPILEVLHARGYGDIHESWKHRSTFGLPDGVLAYDRMSAESFGRFLPTLKVPNFRLSFELEMARQFLHVSPPPFYENASRYSHVILFTASYDPQNPSWPGGLPSEVIKLIRRNKDIFLLVRMHPVMRTGTKYARARRALQEVALGIPNCNLEWASAAPLYAVLGVSTIHLTYDSMSSYEAADVGLISYAIGMWESIHENFTYDNHMQDLRDRGLVVMVEDNEKGLKSILSEKRSTNMPAEPEQEIDLNSIVQFAIESSQKRIAETEADNGV
jgi:hypothetical protein